jgi:serine/threonine-protein kinase
VTDDAKRRNRVELICDAALDRPLADRDKFVFTACGDDVELRAEVNSLLAGAAVAEELFAVPLDAVAADVLNGASTRSSSPVLQPGARVGRYEIVSLLPTKAASETYRARDSKHSRDVALRLLPADIAADQPRLAEIDRRVRSLVSLTHPAVAQIYGLEISDAVAAVAMELVDGTSLADRLEQGQESLAARLTIAHRIAGALAAGHERGMVHGDLKPSNIMVMTGGNVKVLNYGVRQLLKADPAATWQPTDGQTDVWAFGCVLYELLTGRPAFEGGSSAEARSVAFGSGPPWTSLPRDVPPSVIRMLKRCLARDPRQRLTSMAAVHYVLDDAMADAVSSARSTSARTNDAWLWVLVAIAIGAVLVAWVVG